MRLFELAQELKTSDRDLYRQAQALELEIANVVSLLDPEDERALRDGFQRPLEADVAAEERRVAAALEAKRIEAADLLRSSIAADA